MAKSLRVNQRGVSLIEALVAFGVMAFGMLAVVGMQANLRVNGDLARQRSEAVRMAQAEIEQLRGFSVMPTTAGKAAYADVVAAAAITPVTEIANTTYSLTRHVTPEPVIAGGQAPVRQTVIVDVTWQDRNDQTQLVRLSTVIAGVEPALEASLVLGTNADLLVQPGGRNRSIPPAAVNIGGGNSGYVPPNRPSGDTTAFVFNNTTGLITLCSSTAVSNTALAALLAAGGDPSTLLSCTSTIALPLSGSVNFATTGTPAQALTPSGVAQTVQVGLTRTFPMSGASAAVCYTDAPTAGIAYLTYICAVPVTASSSPASVWSGYSYVTGAGITGAAGGSIVCRYTAGPPAVATRSDLVVPGIANVQHPRAYLGVTAGLSAQNFLIVPYVSGTASDCPDGLPLPSGYTSYPQPATAP